MLGINLSGAEFGKGDRYGYDYIYPSLKDLSFYAQKGIELVRLPVKWERMQDKLGGALDEQELGRLLKFLDNAQSLGMKVIIDVHNYGRFAGKAIGTGDVTVEKFADFWSKLADAVGDKPAVYGYDLMNEPHNMPNKTVWPAAAQAAVDAIRTLGDKTTIFVEGESWANATNWGAHNPNLDIKDPADNIVYEAHLYLDKNQSGTYAGNYDQEGATADVGVKRLQAFVKWLEEKGARGFIGEFGVPSDDPRWQVALDNMLQAMNDYGLSGTYWGAGKWFNGYNVGLLDKNGNGKASLDTLLKNLADGNDVGLAQLWAPDPVSTGTAVNSASSAPRVGSAANHDIVDFSTATAGVTVKLDGVKYVSIEEVVGSAFNDVLIGDSAANTLIGGKGNDVLDGGAGADILTGGLGNDVYYVDNARDVLTERVGEGHDVVHATVDWVLGTSFEDLKLDGSAISGTGNKLDNLIVGNAMANILSGGWGDDVLDGLTGADRMLGGTGNDTYYVDNIGDQTIEGFKEGNDTVISVIDWTLGSNVENLTLIGGALRGTGNSSSNRLTANDSGNFLYGLKGNDVLTGGAGKDWLEGGEGNDELIGGAGDDILIGGAHRDTLTGGEGRDTFRYTAVSESKGGDMDRILDFTKGQDVIDLSLIDANRNASGNQAMTFIGTGEFTRKAGQLRYELRDDYTLIEADVNGDGKADFGIRLEEFHYKLAASDFIL
ncbi:cellulase family glycosylhydrolase [Sphingomonas sp. Leaf10]|uniref:cellulase family glycosylhydrolase n=1 Tax=Sphingomonas sp. Leaf10 TaxID=1735676 RepID=UPI0006FC57DA|nr:cellulase family glycosylhydrolase [Sphingomonas sp. Leaf10]KQM30541.1 hypothetical protein ASE59_08205 [Sphingomonas sp. Leaf10]